jgi:hypothetical protein
MSKPLSLRYGLSEFIENAKFGRCFFFVRVRIAPPSLSLSLSRSRRRLNLSGGVDAKLKNRGYPRCFFFEASKVRVAICDWKKDTADAAPVVLKIPT